MSGILALLFSCFAALFTRSHPLRKYRDQLVGHHGIQVLDRSFVPTRHNGRRLLIVGDVHGCLEELRRLLKEADYDAETDHVIFVGDLVAKGPSSLETVTFIDELGHNASCVRGNHDDKLMQWHTFLASKDDPDYSPDRLPDGLSRRDEHRLLAKNLDLDQVNFLESLPYLIQFSVPGGDDYLVVHAGILPDVPLDRQKCWDVTNMRNIKKGRALDDRESGSGWFDKWEKRQLKKRRRESEVHGGAHAARQVVVYGHDAGRGLNIREFSKGLDSRCVRGGTLTALVLTGEGEHYVQVEAARRYD